MHALRIGPDNAFSKSAPSEHDLLVVTQFISRSNETFFHRTNAVIDALRGSDQPQRWTPSDFGQVNGVDLPLVTVLPTVAESATAVGTMRCAAWAGVAHDTASATWDDVWGYRAHWRPSDALGRSVAPGNDC
jgi:hypothetical protein